MINNKTQNNADSKPELYTVLPAVHSRKLEDRTETYTEIVKGKCSCGEPVEGYPHLHHLCQIPTNLAPVNKDWPNQLINQSTNQLKRCTPFQTYHFPDYSKIHSPWAIQPYPPTNPSTSSMPTKHPDHRYSSHPKPHCQSPPHKPASE